MNSHPRIRKIVKWGGAAVTALLVAVWIGSGWFATATNVTDRIVLSVFRGVIQVRYTRDEHFCRLTADYLLGMHDDFVLFWTFQWHEYGDDGFIDVPMWMVVGFSSAVTAFAWRLDTLARRRAITGLCPSCDYDRTSLAPDAKCPECGAAPAIAQQRTKAATDDTDAHG